MQLHLGTCYLDNGSIPFLPDYYFFLPRSCLPRHVLPSSSSSHTHARADRKYQGQPRSLPTSPSTFPHFLSSTPSLPSICRKSLRQLRSDTAALQTKRGAARITATYPLPSQVLPTPLHYFPKTLEDK